MRLALDRPEVAYNDCEGAEGESAERSAEDRVVWDHEHDHDSERVTPTRDDGGIDMELYVCRSWAPQNPPRSPGWHSWSSHGTMDSTGPLIDEARRLLGRPPSITHVPCPGTPEDNRETTSQSVAGTEECMSIQATPESELTTNTAASQHSDGTRVDEEVVTAIRQWNGLYIGYTPGKINSDGDLCDLLRAAGLPEWFVFESTDGDEGRAAAGFDRRSEVRMMPL